MLKEVRLEEFLREHLPKEDGRTKLPTAKTLLVLLRNVLVSREPIYGVGEWAARHAPDLLGLNSQDVERLNDDRVGRALDRLFLADVPSLVLAVAGHVVRTFQISLDELHNDSTRISFFGAYRRADEERRSLGRATARRLIDLFESVQRHMLTQGNRPPELTVTELSHLHRKLLNLLALPAANYGR
jgi:hypothetical protein